MNTEAEFTRVQELVRELRVSDAMTRDVVSVTADQPIRELRTILNSHRISGAPVVDGNDLRGVISLEDYTNWLEDGAEDCLVGDRMTTAVKTMFADEPLILAVSRFEESGFGRFPVVDRNSGKLIGMITKGDVIGRLLRKLAVDYQGAESSRYEAGRILEEVSADRVAFVFSSRVKSGDFDHAGEVSSALRKSLTHLHIHPRIIRRAAIASYEAEMNMVIYSEGGEIRAEVRPEKIKIDVRDSGPGIADIEKALEPGYSTAPDWVRELGFGAGMGLVNIKKCADRLKLSSSAEEGTHLEIELDITVG